MTSLGPSGVPADSLSLTKLVGQLYRAAATLEPTQFRTFALRALDKVAPSDAALWATGHLGSELEICWAEAMLVALPAVFAEGIAAKRPRDPFSSIGSFQQGTQVVSGTFTTAVLPAQGGVRALYDRYGIRSGAYVACANPHTRVSNVVATFRFQDDLACNEKQLRSLETMTVALVDAASFCFSLHLSRAVGLEGRKAAAICDKNNLVIESQSDFLAQLQRHYPGWAGPKLPFCARELRLDGGKDVVPGLLAQAEAFENLRIVRLWTRSELDTLTRREMEFVSMALLGFSDKEIASEAGLSASTVSNRLVGAFHKLGVNSRHSLRRKYRHIAVNTAAHSLSTSGLN